MADEGATVDDRPIGREAELAMLAAMLAPGSLVTLVGLGGSGKTTLAAEAARRAAEAGIRTISVDLAPIEGAERVDGAIAAALGVAITDRAARRLALADALGGTFLVLDNLEHLRGAHPLVGWLHQASSGARILATSRFALEVEGEQTMSIAPLAIPAGADAVDRTAAGILFLRRARLDAARLPDADRTAVAAICRAMDGLPLAIELAAAWAGVLSPRAIERRLRDRQLRLDEPARDRQRSLERIVDATLELVDEPARAAFPLLGVFVAPFDDVAAQAVLGEGPDALAALRSLAGAALVQVSTDRAGEPSFRLLEPVRAVALDRLAADAATEHAARRRHAEHFNTRIEAASIRFRQRSFGDLEAAAVLADPNVRAAWVFADRAGLDALALSLAVRSARIAIRTGELTWTISAVERGLAPVPTTDAERAEALNGLVSMHLLRGDRDVVALAEEAVGAARRDGSPDLIARTLVTLGNAAPDPGAALPALEAAFAIAQANGIEWLIANASMNLGERHRVLGDTAAAAAAYEAALAAYEATGDEVGREIARTSRGDLLVTAGRDAEAIEAYEAALPVLRAAAPVQFATGPMTGLAVLHHRAGDEAAAVGMVGEAAARIGGSEARSAAEEVAVAAAVVLAAAHPTVAARATGLIDLSDLLPPFEQDVRDAVRHLRVALGSARFARERRAGARDGVRGLVSAIAGIVDARGTPVSGPIRGVAETLTPRETEVLRLVADGRSDREIGERLGMTAKTSSVHVANIKGKLGVGTRVEAALLGRRLLDAAAAERVAD